MSFVGTGKTFLGVKIAELLLHNRSVWCPPGTTNAPILMVCQTNHALDQFLEHIITRLNMTEGIKNKTSKYSLKYFSIGLIRVGGRCKNDQILPFSLVKLRQYYRKKHLIPSIIHEQKRDILSRKTISQTVIQSNEVTINISYTYLTSLSCLYTKNIIKIEHYNLLKGGSENQKSEDIILNEWLGLSGKVYMVHSIDDEFEQLNINEDQRTVEEDNEEQEEEERRRDDIDFDEDFFSSTKISPKTNLISINDDDEENGETWQIVRNKAKQKQIIHQLLTYPTELNDEKIESISEDLWSLSIPQRHDLYRYWLQKYRENSHKSVSNAHLEYSRAVVEHSKYLQLEDYYILKNAIIIAMTTTCAAKYFDVLQKLGKNHLKIFYSYFFFALGFRM